MKKVFLIIIIFCLSFCTEQKFENDLTRAKIIGNVSTIMQYKYGAIERFGEIQKGDLESIYIDRFDINGNLIESCTYNTNGNLEDKMIYKYDNYKNLIEESWIDSDGSFLFKKTYEYDNNGNRKKGMFYHKIKDRKIIYQYDKQGNLTKETFINLDGTYDDGYTYIYDNNGHMIEMDRINSIGLQLKTFYSYNDLGNLIEENRYDLGSNSYNKTTYKYDNHGNIVGINGFAADGSLSSKYTIKFVSLDKIGNWIRMDRFNFNEPYEIIERIIEYY